MSSKTAPEYPGPASPRKAKAWSLAARLTAWYAGSAFTLVLAATGFLYWASAINLDREDDQLLGDRVRALRAVMQDRPADITALHREVDEEWEAHERTRVHMRILDKDGKVLVETPGMGRLLPASLFPAPIQEPGHGTDIKSVKSPPDPNEGAGKAAKKKLFRILAVQAAEGGYLIQVALDRSEKVKLLAEYRKNAIIVLGVSLLACTVVGYQIARRGIRPIHNITETARRIRPTNLSERIAPEGLPAELLTLADTFNQMLDRLDQSFARLSRFSADIAHELRTPVSSLRGEVEVALSKARSPEEYREALGSNLEECGRLAHLIDRMLFLARAENPETQIKKEPCDLAVELATVCEFYGVSATDADVCLNVAGDEKVQANVDRSLFQRAVGNLVANALAHTPPGGTVTLRATRAETTTKVEVADTGCGIPVEHLPHVFDRFYRVDHTRSSKNGSVGLGLPIVRTIVELHGGTVEITSEVGQGTRVTLIFPPSPIHLGLKTR